MKTALTFLSVMCCILPALAQTKPAKPDVILVTIDTLRADHVPCYGYEAVKTPALDRLCADGVHFEKAYTPSPITNSSHASILTGLYPSSHGVSDFGNPLIASHITMAEILHDNGYRTAAFIGSIILDSRSLAAGFDRGFDYYDNFPEHPASRSRWDRLERRGEEVVRRATAWLARGTSKPRFLWVHLYDPHDPYEPPAPYSGLYQHNLYDGEIAYADFALGKLLATLDRQGKYASSLIVVLGDHGEGLGQHGEETHGIFLYDSTTRVPFIVKLPRTREMSGNTHSKGASGRAVTAMVKTIDLLPTLVSLLQLRSDAKFDGKSLKDSLLGVKLLPGEAYAETDYPLTFGWAPLKSTRESGFKYIEAPRPEFYDLNADPQEERNLYQPWDVKVQKLRSHLAEFRSLHPVVSSANTAGVDPKTIAELQALGYLGREPGSTTVPEPSMLPDPKDRIQVHNLIHGGMLQEEDGKNAIAMGAFAQALAADRNSVVALDEMGQLEFKSGDYKQAAQHLSRAYALRPQDASIAVTLGRALEKTGDLKAARDILEAALKISPGQYLPRVSLGRVYLALGNLDAAQDQLEAAILLDSKEPSAHIGLARVLLAKHQEKQAMQEIGLAEKADPGSQEVRTLMQKIKQAAPPSLN